MIIDCHTHLYGKWLTLDGISTSEFINIMDECNIDKACVFTLEGFFDSDGCNDILFDRCKGYETRLYPFCTVNPHKGLSAIDEMRYAVNELNMKGLKVHPWLQSFSLTNSIFHLIVEETIKLQIPIIFHCGTPPYACPTQVANLANKYPQAKLILGEAGVKDLWREAAICACRYSNLYLCLGASPIEAVSEILKQVPVEQVLYGSDLGFSKKEEVMLEMKKVQMSNLSQKSIDKIMGGNVVELIDL